MKDGQPRFVRITNARLVAQRTRNLASRPGTGPNENENRPWGPILGVTPLGTIYVRSESAKQITAYDFEGKIRSTGDGISDRLESYSFEPLANRVDRVFATSANRVYAIDLKPIE